MEEENKQTAHDNNNNNKHYLTESNPNVDQATEIKELTHKISGYLHSALITQCLNFLSTVIYSFLKAR